MDQKISSQFLLSLFSEFLFRSLQKAADDGLVVGRERFYLFSNVFFEECSLKSFHFHFERQRISKLLDYHKFSTNNWFR